MNKLSTAARVQIIRCLVEGNSINSTCRITGRSKHTVLNLLVDIGEACQKFHDERVRGLDSKVLQIDEIWNFCHCKQKNVPAAQEGQYGIGSVWTWVALDADTKLIAGYLVGLRTAPYANAFMQDLAARLNNRIQITTDGLGCYEKAIEGAFGGDVDYARLIKT
ncbi:MAG TPA: IS1 family transposase, partial [Tepidisphaeraceae bacterium]|nr:IS1 family transposase [Tepidisphaeraceae bacterium]